MSLYKLSGVMIAAVLAGCQSLEPDARGNWQPVWFTPAASGQDFSTTILPGLTSGVLILEDGGSHTLVALDAVTGAKKWTVPTPPGTTALSPNFATFLDAVLYAGSPTAYARRITDGTVAWSVEVPGATTWSEASADSARVLIGTGDAFGVHGTSSVTSYRANDGATQWRWRGDSAYPYRAFVSGITRAGDSVFVTGKRSVNAAGLGQGYVLALDGRTGAELWRSVFPDSGSSADGAPVIVGEIVVVANHAGGAILGLDRRSGRMVWRFNGPSLAFGPFRLGAVIGDTVYAGFGDGTVAAVVASSGARSWSYTGRSAVQGITTCGNSIIVNDFNLTAVDRSTHRPVRVWSATTDAVLSSDLATDGSRVFVAGTKGAYAFSCK
jgi:outer membrane protein assembly factor BamB